MEEEEEAEAPPVSLSQAAAAPVSLSQAAAPVFALAYVSARWGEATALVSLLVVVVESANPRAMEVRC